MKPTVAKVLIASSVRSLDRTFDYLLPPDLAEQAHPGARVVVPFSHRTHLGYIWELAPDSELSDLSPIQEVLDDPPLLTELQRRLVDWLAEYYFCSRQEVIKLCLPPGANLARAQLYRLGVELPALTAQLNACFEPAVVQTGLELLKAGISAGWNREQWRRRFQKYPKLWDFLLHKQLLLPHSGLASPRVKTKTTPVYRWVGPSTAPETAAAGRVRTILADNPTGLSRAALLTASQVSPAVLTRLLNQDKISCRLVATDRAPAGFDEPWKLIKVDLNQEQQAAYAAIQNDSQTKLFLLHGITGSGKTEIYLDLAAQALERGEQVLYLVPEIALTPQSLARARNRFGEQVALLHSRLSDGERFDQWFRIKNGQARLVLGARSALFAPFNRLGLIIVDEEHETTYKQEETPRYHVRAVAEQLSLLSGAKVVFGSATPSLETAYQAANGRYRRLALKERYNQNEAPQISVVDLRQELQAGHKKILSRELQAALAATLQAQEQAILLLNRRGYASFVLCRDCGQSIKCPACDIALTYHATETKLRCHYCDQRQSVPQLCPNCGSNRIRYFGHGTQKLEQELAEEFPTARLLRLDLDSTSRKGAHQEVYQRLTQGQVDILLGTQMVAKGWDLPRVSLVGVIAADASLNLPDFRAAERTFQLLTQVAGRTGRGTSPGRVIFQTYQTEHYSIQFAQNQDYQGFYQRELEQRRELNYPPFAELIKFSFSGLNSAQVREAAHTYAELSLQQRTKLRAPAGAQTGSAEPVEILGPAPALIPRIQHQFRWQLLWKSSSPEVLQNLMNLVTQVFPEERFREVRVIRDRNPYSIT